MGPGLVVTNGPKTAAWTMDNLGTDLYLPLHFLSVLTQVLTRFWNNSTGIMQCDIAGTTSALCTESFGGSDANFPGTSVYTMNKGPLEYIPATMTAGVVTKTTDSTTTATTAATGTTTGQDSASTTTAEEYADETSTSTGGLPKFTGSGWAVGGVAVALAAAVI